MSHYVRKSFNYNPFYREFISPVYEVSLFLIIHAVVQMKKQDGRSFESNIKYESTSLMWFGILYCVTERAITRSK